jgi:hypothetical protein
VISGDYVADVRASNYWYCGLQGRKVYRDELINERQRGEFYNLWLLLISFGCLTENVMSSACRMYIGETNVYMLTLLLEGRKERNFIQVREDGMSLNKTDPEEIKYEH